jgi:hypothetical protein
MLRSRLEEPAKTASPSRTRQRPPVRLLLVSCLLLVIGIAPACPLQAPLVQYVSEVAPAVRSVDPVAVQTEARELYGVEIVLDGQSWDALTLQAVMDALALLPPQVVSNLGNPSYGPLNILVNRDGRTLSGQSIYPSGANFYSNNDSRNELVLVPDQGILTVLHELGHAYQMRSTPAGRYAWVVFDAEMRDFMQATGWRLLSTDTKVATAHDQTELKFAYDGPQVWSYLSHQDPLEDYANSFALFFYDPSQLASLSPARYQWFLSHTAAG